MTIYTVYLKFQLVTLPGEREVLEIWQCATLDGDYVPNLLTDVNPGDVIQWVLPPTYDGYESYLIGVIPWMNESQNLFSCPPTCGSDWMAVINPTPPRWITNGFEHHYCLVAMIVTGGVTRRVGHLEGQDPKIRVNPR